MKQEHTYATSSLSTKEDDLPLATVKVSKLSDKGVGIAFYEGLELYIDEPVLVDEELKVKVGKPFVERSKRCPSFLVEILKRSPHREDKMECAYATSCGGCQYMHVKLSHQLKLKDDDIKLALEQALQSSKLKDEASSIIESTLISCEESTNRPCRFKSVRYFSIVDGVLKQGFYQSRTHNLVEIDNCIMEPQVFSEFASKLTALLHNLGFKAYDDGNSTKSQGKAASTSGDDALGMVRALIMRLDDEGMIMANLVVSAPLAESVKDKLTLAVSNFSSMLTSFYVGVNESIGNSLFAAAPELIFGKDAMTKQLINHKFLVGPNNFLQVNYDICEKLYIKAIAHCSQIKDVMSSDLRLQALDLCCGVGTMTLALADAFDEAVGIEIVEDSIKQARLNASNNGVSNASFIAGDLSVELPKLLKKLNKENVDGASHIAAVISDPPRVGLGKRNIDALNKLPSPLNLSLIFCSLKALKRDLPLLLDSGFKIESVQGFDMFPHTTHVETLVTLTKR